MLLARVGARLVRLRFLHIVCSGRGLLLRDIVDQFLGLVAPRHFGFRREVVVFKLGRLVSAMRCATDLASCATARCASCALASDWASGLCCAVSKLILRLDLLLAKFAKRGLFARSSARPGASAFRPG